MKLGVTRFENRQAFRALIESTFEPRALSRAYNRNLQPQYSWNLSQIKFRWNYSIAIESPGRFRPAISFWKTERASAQPHVPGPPFVRILHISFVRSSTFSRSSVERRESGRKSAAREKESSGDRDYRQGTKPETDIPGTEPPPSLHGLTLPPPLLVRRYKHPRAVSGTLACPLCRPLLLRFSGSTAFAIT